MKFFSVLFGASAASTVIIVMLTIILFKPILILLGLDWIGVNVDWSSIWVWLGAIAISFATSD